MKLFTLLGVPALALSLGACALAPSTNPKAQLVQQCGTFLQVYTAADQARNMGKLPAKYYPAVEAAYNAAAPVCTNLNSLNNPTQANLDLVNNALTQLQAVIPQTTPAQTAPLTPLTTLTVPSK